jgi:acyl-CoA synthetase (AMP-forming)/AMP-acid ligase II
MHHEHHFGNRIVRCFKRRPASVDQLVREAVMHNAEGEALIWQDRRINYRDLDQQTDLLAANLIANGLKKGDRLAILLSNRPEFLYSVLAAARIGAIAVPINIREQTPGLEYILTHCGAKVLIFDAALTARLPKPLLLPTLQHYYTVGENIPGVPPFEALLKPAEKVVPVRIHEEETAIILYTSGTTGRPKGAMLTHMNVCHSVMHFEICMNLSRMDRSVLAVPASHVTGVIAILLTMVRTAGCTIMMPQFKARDFLELAQKEQLTHTILVPAMYNLCLLEDDFGQFALKNWRIGGYGGAPMPEATIA